MKDRSFRRDLVTSILIVVVIAGLLWAIEFTEFWYDVTRQHEFWELDESLGLMIALLVGSLWFAFGRLHASRLEIARRKAAEASLIENQEQLRSILDHSPVEIYVKDLEGRHILVNRREEQLFGSRSGGVVGKTAYQLFPESCAVVHEQHDRDVVRSGHALEREYEIPLEDGPHTFLAVKFPIRSTDGSITRVGAVVTDITERKASERELQRAKEKAERASAGKSRFLAAASHDLRQPLQAMGLLTGSLAETELNARQRDLVDAMGEAIGSMGSMLSVLLDISELDAGAITPHPVDFEINSFLKRLQRDFTLQAKDLGIDLRFVPCSGTVRSDPDLLERIVANLISNALRYTHSGRVLVGCRRTPEGLRIEVWDTGIGIEEQQIDAVFEEYYQVGNPARDRRKGLGLGLALVDRLARLMDHRIVVRSRLGKGSMFGVEVQRSEVCASAEPDAPRFGYDADEEAAVLLIEDDIAVLRAAGRLLKNWGYQVVLTQSSHEALKAVEKPGFRPDIVVADYRLPDGRDGIETIARVRRKLGSEIPGVVVTGDTSAELTRAVKDAGCDLLLKPVAPAKLRSLLRFRLNGHGEPQPLAESSLPGSPARKAGRSPLPTPG